jgi:hypothetical protein
MRGTASAPGKKIALGTTVRNPPGFRRVFRCLEAFPGRVMPTGALLLAAMSAMANILARFDPPPRRRNDASGHGRQAFQMPDDSTTQRRRLRFNSR